MRNLITLLALVATTALSARPTLPYYHGGKPGSDHYLHQRDDVAKAILRGIVMFERVHGDKIIIPIAYTGASNEVLLFDLVHRIVNSEDSMGSRGAKRELEELLETPFAFEFLVYRMLTQDHTLTVRATSSGAYAWTVTDLGRRSFILSLRELWFRANLQNFVIKAYHVNNRTPVGFDQIYSIQSRVALDPLYVAYNILLKGDDNILQILGDEPDIALAWTADDPRTIGVAEALRPTLEEQIEKINWLLATELPPADLNHE